jgi:hypothetical protein
MITIFLFGYLSACVIGSSSSLHGYDDFVLGAAAVGACVAVGVLAASRQLAQHCCQLLDVVDCNIIGHLCRCNIIVQLSKCRPSSF